MVAKPCAQICKQYLYVHIRERVVQECGLLQGCCKDSCHLKYSGMLTTKHQTPDALCSKIQGELSSSVMQKRNEISQILQLYSHSRVNLYGSCRQRDAKCARLYCIVVIRCNSSPALWISEKINMWDAVILQTVVDNN